MRAELAARLPPHDAGSVHKDDRVVVTPSGKLDRRALPAPDGAADRQAYTAPRNVTEMKLCALWEEVLKTTVGIRDHFLSGAFVKSDGSRLPHRQRIRCSGAVTGHLRPTVEELASVIQDLEESPYEAIQPAQTQDTYPVSSAQKRMYVLQQLEDGGVGYNMPAVLELTYA